VQDEEAASASGTVAGVTTPVLPTLEKQGPVESTTVSEEMSGQNAVPDPQATTTSKPNSPTESTSVSESTEVKEEVKEEVGPDFSATMNIMHSYIASKNSKEEEKRKLQRRNAELKAEREQLEGKSLQLKASMEAQNNQHALLVSSHESIQGQVEKLKSFLKLFQTY